MAGDLYALDFDGVLCDSCGESSLSALKAAKVRWPDLFRGVDVGVEEWIVDQMHILRPVVETGYENLLLVRLLLELQISSIRKSSVSDGLTIERILESWSALKPIIMMEWNEDRDSLIDLFGMALKFSCSEIYIVTTKQKRFADVLLRELAGVTIPSDKIYGLGTGPKVEVLKQLQRRPDLQGLRFHFVEDRLATLKNVIRDPELDGWNLYLGRWGYNTEKERQEAEGIPRIGLLDLPDFSEKLK
ncbi:unnamed protein product [Spirodela intermedia]|uniref:Uncharacterized protein n=1 Tax=Spirodela intermedia TaxID=51605 RepID=A0A7I8IY18_SPIIN|nr:unnamed protein product [Spirodela intermedia]CAA6662602.1 unnamed protein product [Spirodela intermedia]